jgi:hypothetical protein
VSRALVGLGIGLGIALPLALGRAAAAHWTPPETIVAELNADAGRGPGIEHAGRDVKVPRLLVIRVGERWYARTPGARKAQAAEWLARWSASVPQGIIAVLDARTAKPVVNFGAGGVVESLTDAPP